MSEHITKQVNLSAAWLPTSIVILALGLVPGMPNQLFLFLLLLQGSWISLPKKRSMGTEEMPEEMDDATSKDTADFDINSVKDASKISLNIGYGLVTLVSENDEDSLVPSITKLRKKFQRSLAS